MVRKFPARVICRGTANGHQHCSVSKTTGDFFGLQHYPLAESAKAGEWNILSSLKSADLPNTLVSTI